MRRPSPLLMLAAFTGACGGGAPPASAPAPRPSAVPDVTDQRVPRASEPVVPPLYAYAAGLMGLSSTGVDRFRARHPTYDGRGVLIGILDSGVDPAVDGLLVTTTGAPKISDLRDFSGEGRVALTPVTPSPDGTVVVGGRTLVGVARIARLTNATTWYAGELREPTLGPSARGGDAFPVIVAKAMEGWVAFVDANRDGSFDDETPIHDYREGRETISLGPRSVTLAANLGEVRGAPVLVFMFDNSGHGTHVAGIAAGHGLFGIPAFDGVAPGAQILGLKISNNGRGGVSVTGSMARAMAYAARYAEERGLRLVLNVSFGVGRSAPGGTVIDSIVNAFLLQHPGVVLTVSAGNDGPGLSTLGFPGSADLALSAGAAFPGPFVKPPVDDAPRPPDVMGWWSARGGELAKPDLVAPGVAFSSVPKFDVGDEIKRGTSMAAPHAAGLAACLISAMAQEGRSVSAAEIVQALRTSATPIAGSTTLDGGAGEPRLELAYEWLKAGHQGSQYVVRTDGDASAAFRRNGVGPSDTAQVFRVRHMAGLRAARFLLRSDAAWLSAPDTVSAAAIETPIVVHYATGRLLAPGAYTGTVTASNPSDTVAGALFALVSTIVVPYELATRSLVDPSRAIKAASVQRYFLRVPEGATLHVTVVLADPLRQRASVRLYEPSGQPYRDADETPLGGRDGGLVKLTVRADDVGAGVYELDVFAPPAAGAVATVRADIAPVTMTATAGWVEVANGGAQTVTGLVSQQVIGAARELAVIGRGGQAETVTVRMPSWATSAVIDVRMPDGFWSELTGFGVAEFDSAGHPVAQNPLNYPLARQRLPLSDALRGRLLSIELTPAFARSDGAHPWHASVRVWALLPRGQPLGADEAVSVVPGGRERVVLRTTPPSVAADGYRTLFETRFVPSMPETVDAVRRTAPSSGGT